MTSDSLTHKIWWHQSNSRLSRFLWLWAPYCWVKGHDRSYDGVSCVICEAR